MTPKSFVPLTRVTSCHQSDSLGIWRSAKTNIWSRIQPQQFCTASTTISTFTLMRMCWSNITLSVNIILTRSKLRMSRLSRIGSSSESLRTLISRIKKKKSKAMRSRNTQKELRSISVKLPRLSRLHWLKVWQPRPETLTWRLILALNLSRNTVDTLWMTKRMQTRPVRKTLLWLLTNQARKWSWKANQPINLIPNDWLHLLSSAEFCVIYF